jgi:hypothetical protein
LHLPTREGTIHEDTTHFECERGRGVDGVDGRVCTNAAIVEPVDPDADPIYGSGEPVQ